MQIHIYVLFNIYTRFLIRTHTQMHTHLFFNTHLHFSETNVVIKKHTLNTNLSFKTYTYTGSSTGLPLRGGQRINTAAEDARRRVVAEFERCQRRAVSNIDSIMLFVTLKEAYPLICIIQKCLLACPPSQSDCEEYFSLLGLYQGIFTRIFVTKQK